ncbi:hypothetical protein LZ554_004395 [Drepanopeziza brunnea f. sp. 'monogermtubi']|nr:hypothetical protein LZ554_004395 [Drepanopeziza brunnea f. sp. 'monogermtubi']
MGSSAQQPTTTPTRTSEMDRSAERDGGGVKGRGMRGLWESGKKKAVEGVAHVWWWVWVTVLLHNLVAVFIAYTLTRTNKAIISWVTYQDIMRRPSATLGSRLLFVLVNVTLMWNWVGQILEEASTIKKIKKMERIKRVKEEVRWWTRETERLEGVLGVVRDIEAEHQLLSETTPARGYHQHHPSSRTHGAAQAADSDGWVGDKTLENIGSHKTGAGRQDGEGQSESASSGSENPNPSAKLTSPSAGVVSGVSSSSRVGAPSGGGGARSRRGVGGVKR